MMQQTVLLALAIVCTAKHVKPAPPQTCHVREPQYKLSTIVLTKPAAALACKQWGGQLASFSHELEKRQLMSMFDSDELKAYWINNRKEDEDNGNYVCDTEAKCTRSEVSQTERKGCYQIQQTRSGQFQTIEATCEQQYNFICKKHVEQKVFRVSTTKKAWDEAQVTCKAWNGKLVQVDDEKQQKLLEHLLDDSGEFWIGMDKSQPTQMSKQNTRWQETCFIFEYLRNSSMSWINWVNNHAVCQIKHKFICEKDIMTRSSRPEQIETINVINDGNELVIRWEAPSSCSTPISKYDIQVSSYLLLGDAHDAAHAFITEHVGGANHGHTHSGDPVHGSAHLQGDPNIDGLAAHGSNSYHVATNEAYTKLAECGTDPATTECRIPVSRLVNGYKLKPGYSVALRGKAYNEEGWSNFWSPVKISLANLFETPDQVKKLEVNSHDGRIYTIGWGRVSMAIYELYQSENGAEFKLLDETRDIKYVYNITSSECKFSFKVRAKKEAQMGFVYGKFSDILDVFTEPPPLNQLKTKTVINQCGVLMTWDPPKLSCSDVTHFAFQVRTDQNSGVFQDIGEDVCGSEGSSTGCLIPMAVLRQAPYNVEEGSLIEMRGKACNKIGCASRWPPSKNPKGFGLMVSTRSLRKPRQMGQPRIEEKIRHLTVNWTALENVVYELFWQNDQAKEFNLLATSRQTSYTLNTLQTGGGYRFKLRAKNSCGYGPFSEMLDIHMPTVPFKPSIEAFKEKCGLVLAWQSPDSGGVPVQQYKVEVRTSRFKTQEQAFAMINYRPVKGCGKDLVNLKCSLPMKYLHSEPFSLPKGQVVEARVSARNQIGWGKTADIKVAGLREPLTMPKPVARKDEDKNILVNWNQIDEQNNGGQSVTGYELSMEVFDLKGMLFKERFLTESTSWKLEGYEDCKFYRFSVRAQNICGFSAFSPVKVIDTKIPPGKMDVVVTTISGCSVNVKWQQPYNCGSPIEKYIVEVKTSEGEFRKVDQCGTNLERLECEVDMTTLQSEPFYLRYGDLVQVRMMARNAVGFGEKSDENEEGARVVKRPDKMNSPRLENSRSSAISISWGDVPSTSYGETETQTYSLFWSDGSDITTTNLIDKLKGSFTSTNLAPLSLYTFTIKARNDCGYGSNSKDGEVNVLHVSKNWCKISFSWQAPQNEGTPIGRFFIEVKNKKGEFKRVTDCGAIPSKRKCSVQMNTFTEAPFYLIAGDRIEVRAVAVTALKNQQTSETNRKGPLLYITPVVPNIPFPKKDSEQSIMVSWDKIANSKSGGTDVTGYELVWEAEDVDDARKVQNGITTPLLHHKIFGAKAVYRFRLRAKNICGYGAFSPTVKVDTRTGPNKMTPMSLDTSLNSCIAIISWIAPVHGGLPIDKYIIEVKNSKGDFVLLSQCGEDPFETKCEVNLAMFAQPPFNLPIGSLIQVRGTAINERGKGKMSEPNTEGPTVVTRPANLPPPWMGARTYSSISMQWPRLSQKQEGGTSIESFIIEWKKGEEPLQTRLIDKKQADFTVSNITDRVPITFRIKAKNSCGHSTFSDSILVQTAPNLGVLWFFLFFLLFLLILLLIACFFFRWTFLKYQQRMGGWYGCARRQIIVSEDWKFKIKPYRGGDLDDGWDTDRHGLLRVGSADIDGYEFDAAELTAEKLRQDLNLYYMFLEDPERAARESGMTKEQAMQMMAAKYHALCENGDILNGEFSMLQAVLLSDNGDNLIGMKGDRKVDSCDQKMLPLHLPNSKIDKVVVSSDPSKCFFLISVGSTVHKYDLVSKKHICQFDTVCDKGMVLYGKDEKLFVCGENEVKLWDLSKEKPSIIAEVQSPNKIDRAFVNKETEQFLIASTSGEYVLYYENLIKVFGPLTLGQQIRSAEFSYDSKSIYFGTNTGTIVKVNGDTGTVEGVMLTQAVPVTALKRFPGLNDVFVATTGDKKLHLVRDMRLTTVPVQDGCTELGDVNPSGNAKFFAVGLPKQGMLQGFQFDKELTEANKAGEVKEPYAQYAVDDWMSQALFIDPTKRKIEHHMLNWKFDVSKFDTERLATLSQRFSESNTYTNPKVDKMSLSSQERSQRLQQEKETKEEQEAREARERTLLSSAGSMRSKKSLLIVKVDSAQGMTDPQPSQVVLSQGAKKTVTREMEGMEPVWNESFAFKIDDETSNALIQLNQEGRVLFKTELPILQIQNEIDQADGKELSMSLQNPLSSDQNPLSDNEEPCSPKLSVTFKIVEDREPSSLNLKPGQLQIGDEVYDLAPEDALDKDCIWIDGKRYLRPHKLKTLFIDGFEWQLGTFGLNPDDPLVQMIEIDEKFWYKKLTPEQIEERKNLKFTVIVGKIFTPFPAEEDKCDLETKSINKVTQYRSKLEEAKQQRRKDRIAKGEPDEDSEEQERPVSTPIKRTSYKSNLKVMVYSIHNLPSNVRTMIVMKHGHRVVNVGTLKGDRPKWNQGIRFRSAEYNSDVKFHLHNEQGEDLFKRNIKIYPAYDEVIKNKGYEWNTELQDKPDVTHSGKKPIIRVSFIFEEELEKIEQETKELEELMKQLEAEKLAQAQAQIKGGLFSFFKKKKPTAANDAIQSAIALKIVDAQIEVDKKAKFQNKMSMGFLKKIGGMQAQIEDEDDPTPEEAREKKLDIIMAALMQRKNLFEAQRQRELDEDKPKDHVWEDDESRAKKKQNLACSIKQLGEPEVDKKEASSPKEEVVQGQPDDDEKPFTVSATVTQPDLKEEKMVDKSSLPGKVDESTPKDESAPKKPSPFAALAGLQKQKQIQETQSDHIPTRAAEDEKPEVNLPPKHQPKPVTDAPKNPVSCFSFAACFGGKKQQKYDDNQYKAVPSDGDASDRLLKSVSDQGKQIDDLENPPLSSVHQDEEDNDIPTVLADAPQLDPARQTPDLERPGIDESPNAIKEPVLDKKEKKGKKKHKDKTSPRDNEKKDKKRKKSKDVKKDDDQGPSSLSPPTKASKKKDASKKSMSSKGPSDDSKPILSDRSSKKESLSPRKQDKTVSQKESLSPRKQQDKDKTEPRLGKEEKLLGPSALSERSKMTQPQKESKHLLSEKITHQSPNRMTEPTRDQDAERAFLSETKALLSERSREGESPRKKKQKGLLTDRSKKSTMKSVSPRSTLERSSKKSKPKATDLPPSIHPEDEPSPRKKGKAKSPRKTVTSAPNEVDLSPPDNENIASRHREKSPSQQPRQGQSRASRSPSRGQTPLDQQQAEVTLGHGAEEFEMPISIQIQKTDDEEGPEERQSMRNRNNSQPGQRRSPTPKREVQTPEHNSSVRKKKKRAKKSRSPEGQIELIPAAAANLLSSDHTREDTHCDRVLSDDIPPTKSKHQLVKEPAPQSPTKKKKAALPEKFSFVRELRKVNCASPTIQNVFSGLDPLNSQSQIGSPRPERYMSITQAGWNPKSESLVEDELRPSSELAAVNHQSATSFIPGDSSVAAVELQLDAVRPHKYAPRPIITQFTDDPKEIMKGMRTPFITNMNDEYNDPDVQPIAFSSAGPGMNQTQRPGGTSFKQQTGPRQIYDGRSKSQKRQNQPPNSKSMIGRIQPNPKMMNFTQAGFNPQAKMRQSTQQLMSNEDSTSSNQMKKAYEEPQVPLKFEQINESQLPTVLK